MALTIRQFKKGFFDWKAVQNDAKRNLYRFLNHIGSYVKQVAKNSMKSAPGPSEPGTPPHSHIGLIKRHIYSALDTSRDCVVVGPALLEGKNPWGFNTTPEVEEYGGTFVRIIKGRARTFNYPQRSFMGAALDKAREGDRIEQFWAAAVH